MFKFVIFPILFAAVSAGYIGGYGGHGYLAAAPVAVAHAPALAVAHAPVAVAAPVAVKAVAPVATSYANTYKVSQPVAVAAAPAYIKAPVAVAAPAYGVAAIGHGYGGYYH